jgi:hypothetical protein
MEAFACVFLYTNMCVKTWFGLFHLCFFATIRSTYIFPDLLINLSLDFFACIFYPPICDQRDRFDRFDRSKITFACTYMTRIGFGLFSLCFFCHDRIKVIFPIDLFLLCDSYRSQLGYSFCAPILSAYMWST